MEHSLSPTKHSNFDKIVKFKIADNDSEPRKTTYDSASIISTSSEESESSRKMKRKFDIDYKNFNKSKSSSLLFNKHYVDFPIVTEEKVEDDLENLDEERVKERFHYINERIQREGYDYIEEILSENRIKKVTKSTKTLSYMDTVIEVKEDIDFNQLRDGPFKKYKCLLDVEEDSKIKTSTGNLYKNNKYNLEEAETIEEDNNENEIEIVNKKKYNNKFTDFVDKSDMIDEQNAPKDIITEEIKEDSEDEDIIDNIVMNMKRKFE